MPHPYELGRRRAMSDAPRQSGYFVRWTPEEKEKIARASLAAMSANPQLTPIDALRAGIATLPPEKQMRVNDFAKNSWVVPIWERLAKEHDEQQTQQAARAGAEALFAPIEQQTATSEPEPAAHTEGNDMAKKPAAKAAAAPAPAPKKRGGIAGSTLTRWTNAERRSVAKAFLKIQAESPNMSNLAAVKQAQSRVLPQERQRDLDAFWLVRSWLMPLLDEVRPEVELERQANQQTQAEREAEEHARAEQERKNREDMERQRREAEERAQREAEERERAIALARETAVEDFLETAPIEDLIAAAARRLVGAFAAPIAEGLVNAFRDVRSSTNPKLGRFDLAGIDPAPRGINNRPRVYVVGLVRENRTNLSKAFPNLDMAYGSNADEGGLSGEKCAKADLVILMTDFVAHTVRNKVKASAPNFVPVSGGLTSAKRCISQWLAGEANKLAA